MPDATSPKSSSAADSLSADRDRFLSELAIALVDEAEVPGFLDRAVAGIGRLLGVDRVGLFLFSETPAEGALAARASWSADSVAPLPETVLGYSSVETAAALTSLAPVVAPDALAEPALAPIAEVLTRLGTKSLLAAPIVSEGVLRGFVSAAAVRNRREWGAEDALFLQAAARHLAAALKQVALFAELERQRDRLSVLLALAAAVQSSTTEEDVVRTALRGIRETLGFRAAFFGLLTPSGDEAFSVGGYAEDREDGAPEPLAWRVRIDQAMPGQKELSVRVLESGQALVVDDVEADPRAVASRPHLRRLGVEATAVFPMRAAGQLVGIMSVGGKAATWDVGDEDIRLLQSLADFVGVALEQRRAAEALVQGARKLEERTRVLETVARATQLLNFRLHAPDVLASIAEEASRAVPGAAGGVVFVANAEGTALTVAATYGNGRVAQAGWQAASIPLEKLPCAGKAFGQNRAVLHEVEGFDELTEKEPQEVRARMREALGSEGMRQLLAVPIRVADHRLGVLQVLSSRPGVLAEKDAETLGLLAEQAAIALRNARLIEELQRSNRLKDDFLANLSHEVRTPLTGIVGWTEVLLDSGPKDAPSRRALEAIIGQAHTLSRMLTDLIDLSRIDNFGLEIRHTKVRLAETISAALDAVAPTATKKGVPITCEVATDLPVLDGDPARLQQVVWNLLSNAVKFSPPGKPVTVTARADGEGVELLVEDQGAGIEPSFLPLIFDRFRQEETSSSRRFGGLGVGLSIARAIVEAHGGLIEAASEGRDRGARFRVFFPPGSVSRSGAFRRAQLVSPKGTPSGGGGA